MLFCIINFKRYLGISLCKKIYNIQYASIHDVFKKVYSSAIQFYFTNYYFLIFIFFLVYVMLLSNWLYVHKKVVWQMVGGYWRLKGNIVIDFGYNPSQTKILKLGNISYSVSPLTAQNCFGPVSSLEKSKHFETP